MGYARVRNIYAWGTGTVVTWIGERWGEGFLLGPRFNGISQQKLRLLHYILTVRMVILHHHRHLSLALRTPTPLLHPMGGPVCDGLLVFKLWNLRRRIQWSLSGKNSTVVCSCYGHWSTCTYIARSLNIYHLGYGPTGHNVVVHIQFTVSLAYTYKATPIKLYVSGQLWIYFWCGHAVIIIIITTSSTTLGSTALWKWCCTHRLAQRSSRFASQTPVNG